MSQWKWPVGYLILMVLISLVAGLWNNSGNSATCELDGQQLLSNLQAELKMPDGNWHVFCSIECARQWLGRQSAGTLEEAVVRDALTGERLDAYVAFFVRSKIVTNPSNGNNIHAFRYRTEADEHIRRFGGQEMDDPFAAP